MSASVVSLRALAGFVLSAFAYRPEHTKSKALDPKKKHVSKSVLYVLPKSVQSGKGRMSFDIPSRSRPLCQITDLTTAGSLLAARRGDFKARSTSGRRVPRLLAFCSFLLTLPTESSCPDNTEQVAG